MYEVRFYRDTDGNQPVKEYLNKLEEKSIKSKDAYWNTNGIWDSGRRTVCKAFGGRNMGTASIKRQDLILRMGRKFIYFVKLFYEKHTENAKKRD